MEVMGLMLGQFVDDYTVNCIDVFAMPQSGTGVSVEAVDPVFQTKMLDMLKQTGRPEVRALKLETIKLAQQSVAQLLWSITVLRATPGGHGRCRVDT